MLIRIQLFTLMRIRIQIFHAHILYLYESDIKIKQIKWHKANKPSACNSVNEIRFEGNLMKISNIFALTQVQRRTVSLLHRESQVRWNPCKGDVHVKPPIFKGLF